LACAAIQIVAVAAFLGATTVGVPASAYASSLITYSGDPGTKARPVTLGPYTMQPFAQNA
jgi:hypothetical protein